MIVGIHQPIYFPWIGYFDKIAKSDIFVLLDEVQLEKGSFMYRNRILNNKGEIEYITISGDKHGFLDKRFCDIKTTNKEEWISRQKGQLLRAYGNSPYFNEVSEAIDSVFACEGDTICEYDTQSIMKVVELLDIKTKIVRQGDCTYNKNCQKNDLVFSICQGLGADVYLSGNGAKKYMNDQPFDNAGINVKYQDIFIPEYSQLSSKEFVPGLSILDMLFSCGIEECRHAFWRNCNVKK